jgi:hypothetical protein
MALTAVFLDAGPLGLVTNKRGKTDPSMGLTLCGLNSVYSSLQLSNLQNLDLPAQKRTFLGRGEMQLFFLCDSPALQQASLDIEAENTHCNSPDVRPAEDALLGVALEVFLPRIDAWIEEAHKNGIVGAANRSHVGAFVAVAEKTGQRQVVGNRRPLVFLAQNMIHLAAKLGIAFVDETVLAATAPRS